MDVISNSIKSLNEVIEADNTWESNICFDLHLRSTEDDLSAINYFEFLKSGRSKSNAMLGYFKSKFRPSDQDGFNKLLCMI